MTHERVDDDGNIVATPYSAPVGTHKGRSGDDNSQWQYLVTKATGITNFHSPVWDGAVFGNHIKEQKAAGLGGFIDTDQYYGEQHCLMAEKDTRGGFDGCGHYSGESPVGYWEYEAGDVTLQQLQENTLPVTPTRKRLGFTGLLWLTKQFMQILMSLKSRLLILVLGREWTKRPPKKAMEMEICISLRRPWAL